MRTTYSVMNAKGRWAYGYGMDQATAERYCQMLNAEEPDEGWEVAIWMVIA